MAPVLLLPREQRALDLLLADEAISLEELVAMHYDDRIRLADMLLGDLLAAIEGANDMLVRDAAEVLSAWDHEAGAESRGALLFAAWAGGQCQGDALNWCGFAAPWNPKDPLALPDGLADPEGAVVRLREAVEEM